MQECVRLAGFVVFPIGRSLQASFFTEKVLAPVGGAQGLLFVAENSAVS